MSSFLGCHFQNLVLNKQKPSYEKQQRFSQKQAGLLRFNIRKFGTIIFNKSLVV